MTPGGGRSGAPDPRIVAAFDAIERDFASRAG